ncbi:polymeric immunoglobulin receptor-like [Scomber scombrus]
MDKACILFTVILIHVTSAAEVIHVSGYEGREAKVSCHYKEDVKSHVKYLCRNDCKEDPDVLIKTPIGKRSRYSISDDRKKRVFTAIISDLSFTDAGKYWCGVEIIGIDILTEVQLDVKPDHCCEHFTKIQGYEDSSVSISCPYESEDRDNLKYICRGNKPSTCLQEAVVASDIKPNGQFSFKDDKTSSKFTVTITSLTQKDSGMYLCGVQRDTGLDVFSGFKIELRDWCCVKSYNLSGIVGLPVTMECSYPPQHRTNMKFLCKGDHRKDCTDMVTSQSSSDQTDHRFTLQDDTTSSSFLVTIKELKATDAGTYWCGSDRQWSAGNYAKIQLSVVFPQQTSTVETVGSQVTQISGGPIKVFPQQTSTVEPVGSHVTQISSGPIKGIYINRTNETAEAEEVKSEDNDYEYQEVMVRSKPGTSKQHSTLQRRDEDAGEGQ